MVGRGGLFRTIVVRRTVFPYVDAFLASAENGLGKGRVIGGDSLVPSRRTVRMSTLTGETRPVAGSA